MDLKYYKEAMKAKTMVMFTFVLGTFVTGFGYTAPDLTKDSKSKVEVCDVTDVNDVMVVEVVELGFDLDCTEYGLNIDKTILIDSVHLVIKPIKEEGDLKPPVVFGDTNYILINYNLSKGSVMYFENKPVSNNLVIYRNARDGLTNIKS